MKRKLNIISIDGIDGIGKTTQINLLAMSLKRDGISILKLYLDDTINSALDCARKSLEFLDNNENGLILMDGSIARMIVKDMISGLSQESLNEKYRQVIFEYESLSHKYGVVSILMVTDDIEECHKRILKRGRLFGKEEAGIEDFSKEVDTVNGMRLFDQHTMTKTIKFEVLDIDQDDSILDIQENLVDWLADNFDFKKPSSFR